MKPRKDQIYSHMSSIIPGKEFNQETSDKVGNETANKQTRTSTDQEEKKENKKCIPHKYNCLLYFAYNRISQATNHKINNLNLHLQVG